MWRRVYLILILVRLYFALSPSYLHPDENFQGPEPVAGRVFSYPVHLTWEFTSERPIRSSFPLWLFYGIPMYILRWIWEGAGLGDVAPSVAYWTLRCLMFLLSFVLEDWAIQELVQIPRHRRIAVSLVASSYVTWTLQTHTFSNSIETLAVAWSLVLINRIVEDRKHSGVVASAVLGIVVVIGVFNRITFPAFLLVPGLQLLPHFKRKPFSTLFFVGFAGLTAFIAICFDTSFYTPDGLTLTGLFLHPVVTPLNNFIYNSSPTNLAQHGLHPFYQHVIINLPQLLGPAFLLIFLNPRCRTLQFSSAISGVLFLSLFPHQEARFLLPAVPLILSSVRLPRRPYTRVWLWSWLVFNVVLGMLMGVYHQGGIVPAQIFLSTHEANVSRAFWWKTYSPPTWLLNGKNEYMATEDLMGMPGPQMLALVQNATQCYSTESFASQPLTYLVAPRSAYFLEPYLNQTDSELGLHLEEVWSYRKHLNLDDLDFGDDGVLGTFRRVVGDRGLVIWKVKKPCGMEEGGSEAAAPGEAQAVPVD